MSAETALVTALTGAAGVTALVADRIFPDDATTAEDEQTPLPFVMYQRAGTTFQNAVSGIVAIERVQMGLGCYAATRAAAESLANAVHAALVAADFTAQGRVSDFDEIAGAYTCALLYEYLTT